MFITSVMQRIELRFWDIILPLLTKSQTVRKVVQASVSFYHNDKLVRQVALIAMIGCAGFASGILIFTLKNILG
jgi:hypothetical protein